MATRTYTTAQGKQVSMDAVRLENEKVIAVGNMKVDAAGNHLGPGGVPETSRQQTVNQYYNLHTPTVGATQPKVESIAKDEIMSRKVVDTPANVDPRGHMNEALPAEKKVEQKLMRTAKQQVKDRGPQRF